MFLKRVFILCLAIALPAVTPRASAQIYADVSIGGAVSGTFRINLYYQNAPATVANFIGLATGKKGWLDYNTGNLCYNPYYNGVTFHRVIAGFMSQTGSRKGDGTDGPGYTFRNEIAPLLSHTTAYTVAMANAGLDTNGAQWYITSGSISTATAQHLDGSYTIFGQVISGTSVCDALNSVPTNGSSGTPANNPLTPVYIQSITFSGSSLASFNLTPSALPVVLSANPVMKASGSTYAIAYDHAPYSYYIGYDTPDLTHWANWADSYFHATAPNGGNADVSGIVSGSKYFFRLARVDYSACHNPGVLNSLAGKSITFGVPIYGTLVVDSTGTNGTFTFTGGSSPMATTTYSYAPFPYFGDLYIQLSAGYQFAFDTLSYTSGTTGNYIGRTNVSGFSTVTGTFSSSGPD